MKYKVLYRKYRPLNFQELVGQDSIKEALINSIKKQQLAHAYIFTGPRGTGKTSTAKIFAKALTCLNNSEGDSCGECENCKNFNENPDIIEIDAASNNGVDEIREIRNNVKLVPSMSKYKIYIIDEVHMLSTSAWNAFLKTLEEPPSHVIFIFATTDIQKVPLTVLSRCQRYDFHKISDNDIKKHLEYIIEKENFTITDEAIEGLLRISDGCLRDCLSYLDQLSKISINIDLPMLTQLFGTVSLDYIKRVINYIQEDNVIKFLDEINLMQKEGLDCNLLINNMLEFAINEAKNIKLGEKTLINDFSLLKKIINDLFYVQSQIKLIDNPYNSFIITFLEYFSNKTKTENVIQKAENKEPVSEEKIQKNEKIISREIKLEIQKEQEELKRIRINNVFYGASKEKKNELKEIWEEFIKKLEDINNYTIRGYITNMVIEVVSDEYILFSTQLDSDSILFNNNLEIIENEFKKLMKENYKFISLSFNEWSKERQAFIKNKNKERKFINENEKKYIKSSIEEDATTIFGNIVEVK